MLLSWAEATEARAMREATAKVFILGGEFVVVMWIDGLMKVYRSPIVMYENCKYAKSMHHFIPQHSA